VKRAQHGVQRFEDRARALVSADVDVQLSNRLAEV
jgi:hypothetical protein